MLLSAGLLSASAQAEIRVTDDAGMSVVLDLPARRIVSLAPHATELLFAAGAGARVVGVSAFSDYPPPARALPRIGSGTSLDLEGILALRPDLVVAWQSGNPPGQVARLRALGVPVFLSEPRTLADIGRTLQRLGRLAGTEAQARDSAAAYMQRLEELARRQAGRRPVTVFYQAWHQPLMTVSDAHIISDVLRLCGGVNVFAGQIRLTPRVGAEAVLQRDPEVIIAADGQPDVLQGWQRWRSQRAVRSGHLYVVTADLLVRPTPRILAGVEQVCDVLERARGRGAGS